MSEELEKVLNEKENLSTEYSKKEEELINKYKNVD